LSVNRLSVNRLSVNRLSVNRLSVNRPRPNFSSQSRSLEFSKLVVWSLKIF
jgi:hypothetical protein